MKISKSVVFSLTVVLLLGATEAAQKQNKNALNEPKSKGHKHPCETVKCSAGTECVIKPDRKAVCECVKTCRPEIDDRKMVCSNFNVTFDSLCHLHQMACNCRNATPKCTKLEYEHLQVQYFGSCREIATCTKEEMADFPRRMREWLFNIMKDLARRKALDQTYDELEKDAEHSHERQWVNAVIWKFCDLDMEPTNRVVSRHELYPLKAPLLAMEHCIAPFLDSCDADNDHQVTLKEWGVCLGLKLEEIQDKCHKMHNGEEHKI